MATVDMAIELGTSHTSIYLSGNGIVLREPSMVAFSDDLRTKNVKAVGIKAKQMLGKTPDRMTLVSPISEGVVADAESAAVMLRGFLKKSLFPTVLLPRIKAIVCIPCGISLVERRGIEDVCLKAGINEVILVESVIAAAIGVGIPVNTANGGVMVNIGGGTADVAVISLSGIISGCSVNVGGRAMDAAIREYVAEKRGITVGWPTAEKIKEEIGSLFNNDVASMNVAGVDIATRGPSSAKAEAADIMEAVLPFYQRIADTIESVINKCPPEIASVINKTGIHITGGGAKILGLEELFRARLKLPVTVPEDPEYAVISGAGMLINAPELLKSIQEQN